MNLKLDTALFISKFPWWDNKQWLSMAKGAGDNQQNCNLILFCRLHCLWCMVLYSTYQAHTVYCMLINRPNKNKNMFSILRLLPFNRSTFNKKNKNNYLKDNGQASFFLVFLRWTCFYYYLAVGVNSSNASGLYLTALINKMCTCNVYRAAAGVCVL